MNAFYYRVSFLHRNKIVKKVDLGDFMELGKFITEFPKLKTGVYMARIEKIFVSTNINHYLGEFKTDTLENPTTQATRHL